ncbi:protein DETOXIFICATION 21-like isoform X2 [Camellia sinensis]|uniref:protein DETOXIFICATION 21-like isoform X2 n=1 Tax=Camellia sinensis TaxID=4442 RepID=UPI0010363789|nr:protein DETOXIFICATION 21-like isoform X2 [Camellia sinensis]
MKGDINEKLLWNAEEEERVRNGGRDETLKEKIWRETKKMWVVAAPAIFTRFSTFGINVISQAFVGHVGPTELAGYALVYTVLFRFANGILLGMASALETLCGQAYGAKQYHMLALGQEDSIAEMAGTIARWSIPVVFSFIPSFTCQMFLQAQSKNMIIAYLAAFSLSIHVLLSWLLTVKCKYGIPGAMISTILAFWIPNIGQLAFVICGGCPETWKGFSFLAFKDLWPIIKLSLSSGAMLCLELWYNTILVLLTGNMVNAEVAIDALSICLNIDGWEMMISFGFLAAASVRVSNELGGGSSKGAKFSILNIVLTSFTVGLVLFIFFLSFRGRLAYIFTESSEVAAAVADLSPLLACSILLNSIQPVLSGVAVGAGWQSIVAYVNITCYYLVGIPVGVVLGYVLNMQVKGVWIGMLLGTFVQTIVLSIITYRTDWDKQVSIAKKRINKWFVEPDQPGANPQNL